MAALMLAMGVASPIWMRAIDTAGTYLARESEQVQPAPANLGRPASTTGSKAVLAVSDYRLLDLDDKAGRTGELNLIPAAADATKKESKIRNISTVWTNPTLRANTKNGTEAKK
jgi:hypothetical protein